MGGAPGAPGGGAPTAAGPPGAVAGMAPTGAIRVGATAASCCAAMGAGTGSGMVVCGSWAGVSEVAATGGAMGCGAGA